MSRLFALAVLLCLVLPTGGDARPIDLPPTQIPPASAPAAAHSYSCSPNSRPAGSVQ